jgi:hypothetical protein
LKIFRNVFVKNAITFFGAIRRDNEENKKAPAFHLCIQNFKDFFGTKVIDDLVNPGAAKKV